MTNDQNIIYRNFLRLLRAGAFHHDEKVEPMSAWKWKQLLLLAKSHHVAALVWDGIERCRDQFFMSLNDELCRQWQQTVKEIEDANRQQTVTAISLLQQLNEQHFRPILFGGVALTGIYFIEAHRQVENAIEVFFPFPTQGKKADDWARQQAGKTFSSSRHTVRYEFQGQRVEHRHRLAHLSNQMLNHTLQGYIEAELLESHATYVSYEGHRIETVTPTLQLLRLLVLQAKAVLGGSLRLAMLVDLGVLLRQVGDQVDFVKLQDWIDGLHLQRMATALGALLVELLDFTTDELPFIQSLDSVSTGVILSKQLLKGYDSPSTPMRRNILSPYFASKPPTLDAPKHHRSVRLLSYYPSEGIPNLLSSFVRSIARIEE